MDIVAAPWLLLWISAILALLYFLHHSASPKHTGRLPPGPTPLPIIGNLLQLGNKPHRSLTRLAKTYGPLMSLKLGQVTTIVVSNPETAREVLQKNDRDFAGRHLLDVIRVLDRHKASLIWLPAGARWRNLKRICGTQMFQSQKMNDNQALRQNKVRDLVAYVKERGLAGEKVDIGRAAFTVVLNSISNTFFSIDLADIRSESAQDFKELVWGIMEEAGKPNVSDFFPVLTAADLQGGRRRMEGLFRKLDGLFDEIVERRMQAKERAGDGTTVTTNDFLDSLLEYQNKEDDSRIDRHGIKTLLQDLFVAGTDTSSNTIEWAMAELLHNPNTMEKAQAELVETIGNATEFEESHIQQLPYLQAVVKETLRLHPAAPFLVPHRAETSVELCGYTIPKGTRVLVNAWAIGRDEDVWRNPEQFTPERFLGKDIDYKGQDFELIPFGAGRRICPGLPLAFRMIHLILASLLLRYNWQLPEGLEPRTLDMTEKFGFTLAKAIPLQVIPVLR